VWAGVYQTGVRFRLNGRKVEVFVPGDVNELPDTVVR